MIQYLTPAALVEFKIIKKQVRINLHKETIHCFRIIRLKISGSINLFHCILLIVLNQELK